MDVSQATARFAFLPVRLRIVPQQVLKLPAVQLWTFNFRLSTSPSFQPGMAFRRLVCIPQCREVRLCPLAATCPYRTIFEPAPPPGAERLSKNQDIPRPFIFRPPLAAPPDVGCSVDLRSTRGGRRPPLQDVAPGFSPAHAALKGGATKAPTALKGGATKTCYEPGEAFDFTLTLLGKAVDFLPYFILAFREVAREGIGLNRARCELEEARSVNPESGMPDPLPPPSGESTISPLPSPPWGRGVGGEGVNSAPSPSKIMWERSLVYSSTDQLFRTPRAISLADYVQARLAQLSTFDCRLSTVFLTPTYLKSEGQAVRQPEFHHLFKRVRDRLNALCTFYGPGPRRRAPEQEPGHPPALHFSAPA